MFTCEHRPGDPDTLATGSYGSSVKVWHVPTMDLKVSSDRMATATTLGENTCKKSSFLSTLEGSSTVQIERA